MHVEESAVRKASFLIIKIPVKEFGNVACNVAITFVTSLSLTHPHNALMLHCRQHSNLLSVTSTSLRYAIKCAGQHHIINTAV